LNAAAVHELQVGLEGDAEFLVTEDHTAIAMRSGDVPVLATPALTALMEEAAINAVQGHLAEGSTSVGVRIEMRHMVASIVGAKVYAHARLARAEGRRLTFRVDAYSNPERRGDPLGEGFHERVIVEREKFLAKVQPK
jgi:predicted thioesterase